MNFNFKIMIFKLLLKIELKKICFKTILLMIQNLINIFLMKSINKVYNKMNNNFYNKIQI